MWERDDGDDDDEGDGPLAGTNEMKWIGTTATVGVTTGVKNSCKS